MTYPEMNTEIVEILRSFSDPSIHYAANRIEELETQRDQSIEALRYYANPESWTDFASEVMEPEDWPAWTAEVNLPAKSLLTEEDTNGWEIAQAAIVATERE